MSAMEKLTVDPATLARAIAMTGGVHETVREVKSLVGNVLTDITAEELERRTGAVLTLGLPNFSELRGIYQGDTAIICGSGPSLDIERIRKRQAEGARIFAVNKTHDKLIAHGIIPDFGVMLDPNLRVSGYMTPHKRVTYILGTSVDISVWRRFIEAGIRPFYFMPLMTHENAESMQRMFPGHAIIIVAGITTVGGRCINVAGWMGFEDQELEAFDSCYAPGKDGSDRTGLYAVDKPTTYHDAQSITIRSKRTGDYFTCISNGAMAKQIKGFYSIVKTLPDSAVNGADDGRVGRIRLKVWGDGAIPWMAWKDGGPDFHVEHGDPDSMLRKYGTARHWNYFENRPEPEPVQMQMERA